MKLPKRVFTALRRFIRKITFGLQRKMFLMSGITGIFLMLALVYTVSNLIYRFMLEEYKVNLRNQTQLISNLLDSSVDKMISFTMTVALDDNVAKLMSGNYDEFGKYHLHTSTYKLIDQLVAPSSFSDIDLYDDHSSSILSTDPRCISNDFTHLGLPSYQWYQKLMASKMNLIILEDYVPPGAQQEECFAVALKYQPFYSNKTQGLIVCRMNKQFFNETLKDTSYVNEDFIVITNEHNVPIYSSNEDFSKHIDLSQYGSDDLREGIVVSAANDGYARHYRLGHATSSLTGWKIIGFYDQSKLQGNILRINILIVAITALCIGALMVIMYFVSRNFTRPLRKLTVLMKEAESKGYTLISESDSNDETGNLSECFNNMMRSIRENQILRREAEMDALQQQINPHFFYNTLEAINALAAIHHVDEITGITEKMGSMFRYNVMRQHQKFVTIGEELAHVLNYISIQKIRFGERLTLSVDVPDEIRAYGILKFTLQPLVENAVLHGIEKMQENGRISIRMRMEDGLIKIEIFDNYGMSEETLQSVRSQLESPAAGGRSSSIGLRNVYERLKLCYGPEYGIRIESKAGVGTTVTVTIPVQEVRDEYAESRCGR